MEVWDERLGARPGDGASRRRCAARRSTYQTDFPADEFRARHAQVFARIGDNAVAVVQGVHQTEGFTLPRQHNTFYYLSGIETPGAYLLLDGRTKKVTIYLPPRNQRLEAAEGRVLSADDVELVKRIVRRRTRSRRCSDGGGGLAARHGSGAEPARADAAAAAAPRRRRIYAEFSPAENLGQSRGELVSAETARVNDFWDGAVSRQKRFVELLRARQSRAEVRNLNPILDEMRSIKSAREIAMLRRASQIAGLGVMEAMRSTEAGRHRVSARRRRALRLPRQRRAPGGLSLDHRDRHRQHQQHALLPQHVDAEGRRPGAHGLRARLPLLHERHRPRLAGERQVRAVAARAAAVHPRVPQRRHDAHPPGRDQPADHRRGARRRWSRCSPAPSSRSRHSRRRRARSSKPAAACSRTPSAWRCTTSAATTRDPLKPGQVFSVDPQLWVRDENLYLRYEDTVVVTETGVENFTDFLPSELADMEKLVLEKGVVQKVPPVPESAIPRR